jgi:hypothetical protein
MSNFTYARQQAANEAQAEVNTENLKRWLERTHPEIPINDAVVRAFRDDFMESYFQPLSDADFQFSLEHMTTDITPQRVPTEQQERESLINAICSLIISKNDGADGKFSQLNIKAERVRMQYFSVPALQARLQEVTEKQRLQKFTAGEIRQELKAARPIPTTPVLPVEYSAERIKKMESWEIRTLNRTYGASVVNDRLFHRS